jgi:hypothetical protein
LSFDVTFHPIAADELQRFVFEVLLDPGIAESRAAEVTEDPEKRRALVELYEQLHGVEQEVILGKEPFSTLALGIAGVAGYLHPFWYVRGAAVSFLAEIDEEGFGPFLVSLRSLSPRRYRGVDDKAPGRIRENFAGGGLIEHRKLPALQQRLVADDEDSAVAEVFDDAALECLEAAVDYAIARKCGLIEAADLVVPSEDEAFTDLENLRAWHLDNVDDETNARRA